MRWPTRASLPRGTSASSTRATCWSRSGTAVPKAPVPQLSERSTQAKMCTFTGIVRDNSRGQTVTHLDYEAYAEMAVPQMRHIGQEIKDRWPGARVAMAHRTGKLEVGEVSVVVCVSAPHREEAIAACKWGIDTLKESVPIWKKEHAADGTYWIEGDTAKPAS